VRSAHGAELPWSAQADQSWLTVTASGMTGAAGTLVLPGDGTRIAGSIDPFGDTPSFSIRSAPGP